MKKLLTILAFFVLPTAAVAAPVSWDGNVGTGILQPLQAFWAAIIKGDHFVATSTTVASTFPYASTTAVSVSGLTSGNCLQASTGGLLTTTAAPCGTGGSGLSTTSPVSSGNLLYYSATGAGSATGVATTTRSYSGPFTVTGTTGALVGGTNSTVVWTGLATTSQPSSSNLLVSNGAAGVYPVATTSVAASTGISLSASPGALVGGSNLTITNTGVISNSCPGGFLSCSGTNPSSFTLGTLGTANGGTATTTWYNGGVAFYNSTLGTISQSAAPANFFWDETNKRLGIGTTTPNWPLQVAGTRPSIAISDTAAGTNLKHWLFSSMGGNLYIGTSTDAYATSTPAALTLSNAGNVGISTSSPGTALSIGSSATNYINLVPAATSTFGAGINVKTGCFAVNGTCVGSGSSGSTVTTFDATSTTPGGATTYASVPISVIAGDKIMFWTYGHTSGQCASTNILRVTASLRPATYPTSGTTTLQTTTGGTSSTAVECGANAFGYFAATTTDTIYLETNVTTSGSNGGFAEVMAQRIR